MFTAGVTHSWLQWSLMVLKIDLIRLKCPSKRKCWRATCVNSLTSCLSLGSCPFIRQLIFLANPSLWHHVWWGAMEVASPFPIDAISCSFTCFVFFFFNFIFHFTYLTDAPILMKKLSYPMFLHWASLMTHTWLQLSSLCFWSLCFWFVSYFQSLFYNPTFKLHIIKRETSYQAHTTSSHDKLITVSQH